MTGITPFFQPTDIFLYMILLSHLSRTEFATPSGMFRQC
ncbi:Uncharacterized protein dnm_000460 [Desulfonema magnum]|uniref:Uncharacterized protein n=1 Tax=Desulfonema magnum TaxID=45655 RepID=A0A975BF67_9BACT|nr:Uncharacterized protein dnm_000460 [Desulfonema magnum]